MLLQAEPARRRREHERQRAPVQLPRECRVAAVELLLTLAEGAPAMCAKLRQPPYAALLLDVLVPMMLRLPDDSGAWEEAEPDDGLARDIWPWS